MFLSKVSNFNDQASTKDIILSEISYELMWLCLEAIVSPSDCLIGYEIIYMKLYKLVMKLPSEKYSSL